MASRLRADDRTKQGLLRLRNNTDFVLFRQLLEVDLAKIKDQLVGEADPHSVRELQGRARQIQDILKLIQIEE